KPADGHLCEQYNPCMHKCRNSGTTLVCECHEGYRLEEDKKSCADVDECSEGLDDCGLEQQTCLNTYGGFQCLSKDAKECPAGYKWNEDSCVDVNECAESLHACDARFEEECKNTVGGYVCDPMCSEGLRYSHHFEKCLDIDECQERTHDCNLRSQECINVNGSYSCRNKIRCPAGYRLDENTRSCIDVDECLHGLHSCSSRESKCVNAVGSYRCIKKSLFSNCPRGFVYSSHLKGCEGRST
ncbi:unnamed protein product, partial [Ixodes persulcatus]